MPKRRGGAIIDTALEYLISLSTIVALLTSFFLPTFFPSHTYYYSTSTSNGSQVPYVVPKVEILSSENVTVLNFTIIDNFSSTILISNISVNNATVYHNDLVILRNATLTVYFPLNNISIGSTNTVSFIVHGNGYNITENVTAKVGKVPYKVLENITDVVIVAYIITSNGKSVLAYYITNYSPLPIYLQKIQFSSSTLLDQTVEVKPLYTWNENFTVLSSSTYVLSTIKNEANYTEVINSTTPSLANLGI